MAPGGHFNTEPPPPDRGGPSSLQLAGVYVGAVAVGIVTWLAVRVVLGGWVAFGVAALVGAATGWILDSRLPHGEPEP